VAVPYRPGEALAIDMTERAAAQPGDRGAWRDACGAEVPLRSRMSDRRWRHGRIRRGDAQARAE
jgi:hypothetical protein